MELSWIASPYGLGLGGMLCILIGFIVSRGVYIDKDDQVLKIGSKRHPETLREFKEMFDTLRELSAGVVCLRSEIDAFRRDNDTMKATTLKMLITNTHLPVDQRVEAYDEYHNKLHKNGWVEAYFESEVRPLLEQQVQGAGR
jgi:hypothetical protein